MSLLTHIVFFRNFAQKMSMKKLVLILTSLFFLISLGSCGLKKQVSVKQYYPPTEGSIPIIQTNQQLPANIFRIGSIVVGESGLTPDGKCTYEACMQTIEKESRRVGAQLVYLVRVKEPDSHSTCYNITAELYRYSPE